MGQLAHRECPYCRPEAVGIIAHKKATRVQRYQTKSVRRDRAPWRAASLLTRARKGEECAGGLLYAIRRSATASTTADVAVPITTPARTSKGKWTPR
jgi:hypothetical protein